jgi:superfamily I DNA/RNA helicase
MSKRKPTPQQQSCIEASTDSSIDMLKIEACAGAGKTSTLCMMAEANAVPSLYLAFNKVTAEEASAKFPGHVTCKTTHSVAYAAFGKKIQHKLSRPKGRYVNVAGTGSEVARYFNISPVWQGDEVAVTSAFIGLLVKTTVARFEQSADAEIKLSHTPYGELMEKFKSVTFDVKGTQQAILHYARKLWDERTDLSSPVLATHDTYLKMYQLSKPILAGFDVLYVDEFQDTTPCVLDIVLNQRGRMKIIMVGDARQAIYGWRGAVNAMKMVDAESRMLTKSFRYGQAVADIATSVLEGAMQIEGNQTIKSVAGLSDMVDTGKPYTRLFRTNAALLEAAIGELRRGTEISIEIDVKDFVKLLQSAVALQAGIKKDVKHDKILPYNDWDELVGEAKHDPELARIGKIVNDGKAERWIQTLEYHANSDEPHVTFTTAHKSKGREFSQVIVESDFKSCFNEDGEFAGLVEEEQNLLYVACTRAIDVLEYNQTVQEYLSNEEAIKSEYDETVEKSLHMLKKDVREALEA